MSNTNWAGAAETGSPSRSRRPRRRAGRSREEPEQHRAVTPRGIEYSPTIPPPFEPTAAGLKQLNETFRAGFPDLRATIDEIFSAGDWVAAHLTWTGTNHGQLFGQPPTGKAVAVTEIEIVRYTGGRIVELRQLADLNNLMTQLSG